MPRAPVRFDPIIYKDNYLQTSLFSEESIEHMTLFNAQVTIIGKITGEFRLYGSDEYHPIIFPISLATIILGVYV